MKKIALFLVFFAISCQIRPVYRDMIYKDNQDIFSKVQIHIIPDNSGKNRALEAKYYNLLHKELNIEKNLDEENPEYKMEIILDWKVMTSLRKSSGSSSRRNIQLNAHYIIKNEQNEILVQDKVKTIGSLDVSSVRFTNYSYEQFVLDNLIFSSINDLKNKIISVSLIEEKL